MRVLSGIQPTGRPHWGNFFGAIQQYLDLQEENDGFYYPDLRPHHRPRCYNHVKTLLMRR